MKKITIIILLLFFAFGFSQSNEDTTWKSRITKIESQMSEIDKKNYDNEIANLKDKLDFQQKLNEQTINSISIQLESASYNLTIFGILFAIAAIGLGLYVTNIESKIVRISEENQKLLTKNQNIKEDVETLNKLIQSDINGLFLKIKREESIHILDRLVKVPRDIMNVCETLVSRELHQEDFEKLRLAFFNLGNLFDGEEYNRYRLLFFQHFIGDSLKDEKLRPHISKYIIRGISLAFENDMFKSTVDFTTVVVDKGIQEFKQEINLFFYGLANSTYKNHSTVYQLLFDNLKTRKNRFDLYNVVDSDSQKRVAKIEFGSLLHKKYSLDSPTESEILVFNEINELIVAQEKEEVEVKQKK